MSFDHVIVFELSTSKLVFPELLISRLNATSDMEVERNFSSTYQPPEGFGATGESKSADSASPRKTAGVSLRHMNALEKEDIY